MNDESLRRALDVYANGAPEGDPRPGMRALLARRRRARAAAVAGTACLALAAVSLRGPSGTAGLVTADGPTAEPTATATPTGTPAPSPAVSPGQAESPAPAEVSPPAEGERPAPDTRPVTVTGRGDGGLRLTATLSQRGPAAGSSVTLDVVATDDDSTPMPVTLSWGEGRTESYAVLVIDCAHSGGLPLVKQPPPPPRAGRYEEAFPHAWRRPGHHTLTLKVTSDAHCSGGDYEDASVSIDVDVRPGTVTTNGSGPPVADGLDARPDGSRARSVQLIGYATDADGWVSEVTVDWGDGSGVETIGGDDECDDGSGRYYPSSRVGLADFTHTYETAGTYDVTVTMTSTGCGGEDAQRAEAATTAEV